MDIQKQNQFLLNLVNLLLADLGAHLAFLEWVKMVSRGEDVEGILAQSRRDPAVQPHVDAYLQWLSVKLSQSAQLDPAQAYREFLRQWTSLGEMN
jgi:hypothetical protein